MATGDATNIGTTEPPQARAGPLRRGDPIAERAEGRADGLPVAQMIQPDPLWISRWQPSATVPRSKAPWIIAYRFWHAGAAYESTGRLKENRIDCWFKDGHKHRYIVPRRYVDDLKQLKTSVGQWLHRNLLLHGRDRFPGGPIS